jgi:hypothetical protein
LIEALLPAGHLSRTFNGHCALKQHGSGNDENHDRSGADAESIALQLEALVIVSIPFSPFHFHLFTLERFPDE